MTKTRISLALRTASTILGIFLLLGGVAWAAPGDKGTVLANSFKISDVISVGELGCCGSTFKVDISVTDLNGQVLLLPRLHFGGDDSDTMVFDLQGFEQFLQLVKQVETVTGDEKAIYVGGVPSVSLLKDTSEDRTVVVAKITQPQLQGAVLTVETQTEKVVAGHGWAFEAATSHVGWPAVVALLDQVTPTAKAYLNELKTQNP